MSGPRAAAGLPFAAEVAAYLACCADSTVPLNPAYHPTEAGAVKLIFHRRHRDKAADQDAETQIREAFRALTAPRRLVALPGGRTLTGPRMQPQTTRDTVTAGSPAALARRHSR